MNSSPWIMSEGGPLLCIEYRLLSSWRGIHSSSLPSGDNEESDYDRISRTRMYLEPIAIRSGFGLALGDGPLDSRFWCSKSGITHIVRIDCCEKDFDEDDYMTSFGKEADTLHPVEDRRVTFATSRLVMFDSAEGGDDFGLRLVSTDVEPGTYSIKTFRYDRDPSASLVIHRFDRLGD